MNQEQEFKKLNKEYAEKFEEPISLFMVNGTPLTTILRGMKKAIETGKPYEYPAHPKDAIF
jgi:2-oxo-4-hydroxy-4-carboxy--5-ureidoimidazoline (OHCU) decarboxylase